MAAKRDRILYLLEVIRYTRLLDFSRLDMLQSFTTEGPPGQEMQTVGPVSFFFGIKKYMLAWKFL